MFLQLLFGKWELKEQKRLLLNESASMPVTASSTICNCTKDVHTLIPATLPVALCPSAPPFVLARTAAPPPAPLPFTQPSLPTPIPVPNPMLLQQQPMTMSSPLMPCTPSQLPPLSKFTGEGSSKDSDGGWGKFSRMVGAVQICSRSLSVG